MLTLQSGCPLPHPPNLRQQLDNLKQRLCKAFAPTVAATLQPPTSPADGPANKFKAGAGCVYTEFMALPATLPLFKSTTLIL